MVVGEEGEEREVGGKEGGVICRCVEERQSDLFMAVYGVRKGISILLLVMEGGGGLLVPR